MSYHNECKEDEVFVGNTTRTEEDERRTMPGVEFRLGETAYYIDGKPIPAHLGCRPEFIKKSSQQRYDYLYGLELSRIRNS